MVSGFTTTNAGEGLQLGLDSGRPQVATLDVAGTFAMRPVAHVVSNGANSSFDTIRSNILLINATAPYSLAGITVDDFVRVPDTPDGVEIRLTDGSGQNWTISHASGGAAFGRRFYCPGGSDITLGPYQSATVRYIDQFSSWVVVAIWPSSSATPSGAAGGDLGATYPNPTVVSVANVTTGVLTVTNGGTGDATLTNHGTLIGQGTSAIAATATGTTGQILTSNGASADPTYQDNAALSTTPSTIHSLFNSQATPIDITVDNNFHVVATFNVLVGGTGDVVCISAAINWNFSIGSGGGQTIHYGIGVGTSTSFTGRDCTLGLNANANIGGSTLYRVTGLSAGLHTVNLLVHSSGSQTGIAESSITGDLMAQVA
jgi:hypothetical protein